MAKKLLICVLCLLLAGCTVIKENTPVGPEIKPPAQSGEPAGSERFLKANLYFLNQDETKFVIDSRIFSLQKNDNPAETAVKELVQGPKADGQNRVIPEGVTLERVEAGDQIADIYMHTGDKKLTEKDMFIFRLSAADTLIDLLGITYVNVFWDGMQKSANGLPIGPQVKINASIEEAWNKEQEERAAQSGRAAYDGKAILYFAAKDAPYILPEVRNVSFSSENGAAALIDELIKGPKNTGLQNGLFSKQTQFIGSDFVMENGLKTLILHFGDLIRPSEFGDQQSEMLMYASLVYTLTGILTDVETIKIDIKGKTIKNVGLKKFENGMRRSDFSDFAGKSIPLYMMVKDSTLLTAINRTITQKSQWDAASRLKGLFAGPKENDPDYAWPILPALISEKDILDVTVNNDTAIVNLSAGFKEKCSGISADSEMLLVYGIVNTLTEMKGVRQVSFLIEGKPVEKFAGFLYMARPFVKNPGIIKKSL